MALEINETSLEKDFIDNMSGRQFVCVRATFNPDFSHNNVNRNVDSALSVQEFSLGIMKAEDPQFVPGCDTLCAKIGAQKAALDSILDFNANAVERSLSVDENGTITVSGITSDTFAVTLRGEVKRVMMEQVKKAAQDADAAILAAKRKRENARVASSMLRQSFSE